MRKNSLICAILVITILSFLPIQAVSPDEGYLDSTIPQYDFYENKGDESMAGVVNATYHSCWDSGLDIESNCKVDLKTKEVFDIEIVNVDGFDLEILEDEFVEIDECQYAVYPKSELEEGSNSYWREN